MLVPLDLYVAREDIRTDRPVGPHRPEPDFSLKYIDIRLAFRQKIQMVICPAAMVDRILHLWDRRAKKTAVATLPIFDLHPPEQSLGTIAGTRLEGHH
jgi:hypothetical protein